MNRQLEMRLETILGDLRQKSCNKFKRELSRIDFSHDVRMVVTNSMVREAAEAARDNVHELATTAVNDLSLVSKTPEAFGLLKAAIAVHLSVLGGLVERWNGMSLHPDNLRVADERFAAIRQDLILAVDARQSQFRNSGGRPQEYDWEGAKAHIKASFPNGFKARRGLQTEIMEVMADWFSARIDDVPSRTQMMMYASNFVRELSA